MKSVSGSISVQFRAVSAQFCPSPMSSLFVSRGPAVDKRAVKRPGNLLCRKAVIMYTWRGAVEARRTSLMFSAFKTGTTAQLANALANFVVADHGADRPSVALGRLGKCRRWRCA